MSAAVNAWLEGLGFNTELDPANPLPILWPFVDHVCEQAGRVPLFANLSTSHNAETDVETPVWIGPSHSISVDCNYDATRSGRVREIRLSTPLFVIKINRQSDDALAHNDLLASDPASYMRKILSPLTDYDPNDQPSEEECLDAMATAWSDNENNLAPEQMGFSFGSRHLGSSSDPRLPCRHPVSVIFRSPLPNHAVLSIRPFISDEKPWDWSPVDLMQRIARHHERRNTK